jgi:uncharacterized 2Fe-2S/4Fe-4S cluster protein (DUF4445 family)
MDTTSLSGSWVRTLDLQPPSMEDNTGDADRVLKALRSELRQENVSLDLELLQDLPEKLRQSGFSVRCTLFGAGQGFVLTGIQPAESDMSPLGLAVDLGTSRFVLKVLDLATGQELARRSLANPQVAVGPDILTRIHHSGSVEGRRELKALIVEGVNSGLQELSLEQGFDPAAIRNIALAGNTAMTHLFLGIQSQAMIREPYIPAANEFDLVQAGELGLQVHPRARVYCFPNVGSYFGGDLLSGIVASGMADQEEVCILVDVGTNAEVVLGNREWLIVCAGAAGPALEGGMSSIGKQAGPGIIDQVHIDPQSFHFDLHTIDELPPEGICGSGVIDLAAELFKSGLLDFRGKFVPDLFPERFVDIDGIVHLILVPEGESANGDQLLFGQPEVDSLIRSKAAMFTILETLLLSVGLGFEDLNTFYVAGTFGHFISPESAVSIGMLPDLPRETFQSLGNSSLEGATRFLLDRSVLDRVRDVKQKITYLELNVNQEFMNRFSAAKFLPHTDRERFPSVSMARGHADTRDGA